MAHGPSGESDGHAARLFIVCGRERQVEELHALFSTCGAIRNLHVARDRSQKSRVRPTRLLLALGTPVDVRSTHDGHDH